MKQEEIANSVVIVVEDEKAQPGRRLYQRNNEGRRPPSSSFFRTSNTFIFGGTFAVGKWMDTGEPDAVPITGIIPSDEAEYKQIMFEEELAMNAREEAEKRKIEEVIANTAKVQAEFAKTIVLSIAFRAGLTSVKTLTERETELIQIDPTIDRRKFKGSKTLFASPRFNAINTFIQNTHRKFASMGIPFPLRRGMQLVSVSLIPRVEDLVEEIESGLKEVVADFIEVYPDIIKPENVNLGPLYNPADYKPVESIAESFSFSSRWMYFGVPEALKEISEEFFRKEQQRAAAIWAEAKEQGICILRQEIAEFADRLVDSLTPGEEGAKKRWYTSNLTKITDFISMFEGRNIADDAELAEQVERIRQITEGIDPTDLGKDFDLREKVRSSMETVKANLNELVVAAPNTQRIITFND